MPYYIMEYLAGGSLRQHMDESFSSDDRYVLKGNGLSIESLSKMIDLKPENRQQSIWDLIYEGNSA